jgi:hypothetical protein
MGFGIVKADTLKLAKVGDSVTGHLIQIKSREFVNGEGEQVEFTKIVLKTASGVKTVNVSADFAPILVLGLATKVEKIKKVIDGEDKAVTQVSQDPDDKISV